MTTTCFVYIKKNITNLGSAISPTKRGKQMYLKISQKMKKKRKILYIELYFLSTNPLVQLYMPPPVDPARMRAMYNSTTLSPNNTNSQKTCKRQSNDKRLKFMSFSALPLSRQCTDIFMAKPDRYAIKKY